MSAPLRVHIQRPDQRRGDRTGRVVGRLAAQFLDAWFLMLALPLLFHTHWSYWQAVVAVFVVKVLIGHEYDYTYWTVAGKKAKS